MPFPINLEQRPDGFTPLAVEPDFNPSAHLALEPPQAVLSLTELGYSGEEVAACPSDFAVSGVFRILSREGAACLYEVCKGLEAYATANPRIERCVRGGVYRSRFLRDLCLSPAVTEFISSICRLELQPHTIPHQLGHLNYAPQKIGDNVDKWHVDTLRYDYVMFVTDPNKNQGGAFQYYRGTKGELAALRKRGEPLPADKVCAPAIPGAGYAVMQQGNMVVHQAKGLTAVGERITMVNGYMPQDPAFPDYTRYDQLVLADPPAIAAAEYSRHVALQAQRLLAREIEAGVFSAARESVAARLSEVAQMLDAAAAQIRAADAEEMEHFGD